MSLADRWKKLPSELHQKYDEDPYLFGFDVAIYESEKMQPRRVVIAGTETQPQLRTGGCGAGDIAMRKRNNPTPVEVMDGIRGLKKKAG